MKDGAPCDWQRTECLVYATETVRGYREKRVEQNRWWAIVNGPPSTPAEELVAIATLMRAAPKLLAAAKQAKEYLDNMGLDWFGKGPDPLEAAIAEAESR